MGDIVRICKKSEHYSVHMSNPRDIDGKIIEINYDHVDTSHGIRVMWDNGKSNVYNTSDLKMRRNGGNHGRA